MNGEMGEVMRSGNWQSPWQRAGSEACRGEPGRSVGPPSSSHVSPPVGGGMVDLRQRQEVVCPCLRWVCAAVTAWGQMGVEKC